MTWMDVAKLCEQVYGCFVDYDEMFFICPHCDEPIYAEDFVNENLEFCPVCEEWFDA